MLLFCTKLQKVTLVVFPVKNDRTAINFYKSVIMLYYHQILDLIFLSTCFLSFRTGFVFLFASD